MLKGFKKAVPNITRRDLNCIDCKVITKHTFVKEEYVERKEEVFQIWSCTNCNYTSHRPDIGGRKLSRKELRQRMVQ